LKLSLPALALLSLQKVETIVWAPVFSVWVVLGGAALWAGILARWWGWRSETVACLLLTAGFSNTSFVGFPLLEAYIGKDALPVGVQVDQLGSFLMVSTVGVGIAARAVGKTVGASQVMGRILRFVPLYAAILGLLLRHHPLPTVIEETLGRLGATLSPLALVSVGTQLRWPTQEVWSKLGWGLGYKLLLAPALVWVFLRISGTGGLEGRATLAESAMAPMITSALLAVEAGLEPELASAMVSVGVPLSVLTVWFWCQV
jgi:hypothetical protein